MSRSLYRDYRPETFAEVVGQEHVVQTLSHAIGEARVSHAYLFCGPRGTGKTTMARLLAKAMLCKSPIEGRLPDGECEACQKVASGTHPDVYELDAASRTGVDNVRDEIINRIAFAPTEAPYKIYIIDEVHMLTTAAFNALLKTLEEPPAHVIFVLCTTDAHKVPETIVSRCQRFDFHRISKDDVKKHLERVCTQEGFDFDAEALELIARHARGGMRDALSLLEQLSIFGQQNITLVDARALLGEVGESALSEIVGILGRRDTPGALAWLADFCEQGTDLMRLMQDLAAYLRDMMVVALAGAKEGVVSAEGEELDRLMQDAEAFGGIDRLRFSLEEVAQTMRDMRTMTDQRLCVELAFMKIARPSQEASLAALLARVEILEDRLRNDEAAVVSQEVSRSVVEQAQPAVTSAAAKPAVPQPKVQQPVASQQSQVSRPAATKVVQQPQASQHSAAQQPAAASKPAAQAQTLDQSPAPQAQTTSSTSISHGEMVQGWNTTIAKIRERQPSWAAIVQNSFAQRIDGDELVVELGQASDFSFTMLNRPDIKKFVHQTVEEIFKLKLRVKYCVGASCDVPVPAPAPAAAPAPTPAAQAATPAVTKAPASTPASAPAPDPVEEPSPEELAALLSEGFGGAIGLTELTDN